MKAQGFSQHIVLYAKGWYKSSHKDIIGDLKKLLSVYSNTDLQYISDHDAWEFLCRTFSECVTNKHEIYDALFEITGRKWAGFEHLSRKPEEVMIGKIAISEGHFVDPESKLNFTFGEIP